jgi:hypothetical protein
MVAPPRAASVEDDDLRMCHPEVQEDGVGTSCLSVISGTRAFETGLVPHPWRDYCYFESDIFLL